MCLAAGLGLALALSAALAADTLRTYGTDSAHGDKNYGVKRNNFPSNSSAEVYGTGNCAHCHEQHALIGGSEPAPTGGSGPYAVFSAGLGNSDNFCLNCHGGAYQSITNHNYTYRFGGYAANPVTSISQAFGFEGAGGSAHTLATIGSWAYAIGGGNNQHEDWGFVRDDATNPCLACHDVHRAQRTTASADATKAAIILPVAHNQSSTYYRKLWGDDPEERQNTLSTWSSGQSEPRAYQAPYRYPAASGLFEPDGSSIYDGSNIPNYTEQCLACHRKTVTGVKRIKWDATITVVNNREMHGLGEEQNPAAGSSWGDLRPPYTDRTRNYIVGCTDCHEPHGSRLPYLLREEVNGQAVTGSITDIYWKGFCACCHTWPAQGAHQENIYYCGADNCHGHGAKGPTYPQF